MAHPIAHPIEHPIAKGIVTLGTDMIVPLRTPHSKGNCDIGNCNDNCDDNRNCDNNDVPFTPRAKGYDLGMDMIVLLGNKSWRNSINFSIQLDRHTTLIVIVS